MSKFLKLSNIAIICLLVIITVIGILSFDSSHSYNIINQYGESVKIYGSGIYKHDSYFKAPIFIGSDFVMLVLVVPMLLLSVIKIRKETSVENMISYFSILSIILYYSASISLGVTYNHLHLLYIALFGVSLFSSMVLFLRLYSKNNTEHIVCNYTITGGMRVFLIISGVSLFIAWLPDIVSSIIKGTSLELIEVYTTDITYVLDMGIISPLIFVILYLVKKNTFIGLVLFRMILKLCTAIGVMVVGQTIFQLLSGIQIALPVLATKVLIFAILASFALYFELYLKKRTSYIVENFYDMKI